MVNVEIPYSKHDNENARQYKHIFDTVYFKV